MKKEVLNTKAIFDHAQRAAIKLFATAVLVTLGINGTSYAQGVGINSNGAAPHSSAGLDVDFNNKGILPPRLTTAQRNEILNPADGLIIFNMTTGCPNYRQNGNWYEWCGRVLGQISTLVCSSATINGSLIQNNPAVNVNAVIPYTMGNGGAYDGQTVGSTGVTGLTATLSAGNLQNGNGSLTYIITGTPNASGAALFVLNIGGQSCTLSINVSAQVYPVGTVHCTNTPTAVVDVTFGGKTWMDRNLGASQKATSITDELAQGDLYQWGRKADGHQCRNSATINTLSSLSNPDHGFFILALNFGDWRNPENVNLWNGVNAPNNPCPIGYRIPTSAEWLQVWNSMSPRNAANLFATTLKLPATSRRNGQIGVLENPQIGTFFYSCYWGSDASAVTNGYTLATNNAGSSSTAGSRNHGCAVRCIKN